MMLRLRRLFRRLRTPVSIMLIPHSRSGSINFSLPVAVLALLLLFSFVGVAWTVSASVQVVDYWRMKRKMAAISRQVSDLESTMTSLKESESQFRHLFALSSKKEVLRKFEVDEETGSIDIDALKEEVRKSMESVGEIKEYLRKEKDLQSTTPQGWPARGAISSGFGMREHPKLHTMKFHSGVDITLPSGTPVAATAAGIVSFSGRSGSSGNIVVIEHGHGFSSIYAHNSRNIVQAGKSVRKGDLIAYSGSTGLSTGPHVHYEIWKNGRSVDPDPFLKGN